MVFRATAAGVSIKPLRGSQKPIDAVQCFRDLGNQGGFAGAGRIASVAFQKEPDFHAPGIAARRQNNILTLHVMAVFEGSVETTSIKSLFDGGLFFDSKVEQGSADGTADLANQLPPVFLLRLRLVCRTGTFKSLTDRLRLSRTLRASASLPAIASLVYSFMR